MLLKTAGVVALSLVWGSSALAKTTEEATPKPITSLGQVESIVRTTQAQFWQLIPPVNDPLYIHPDPAIRVVDWRSKEWPKSVLKQMFAEMKTVNSSMYPVYRLTVVESRTGELIYYNSYDQKVWRTPAPLDYNEYLFAFQSWNVNSIEELTFEQKISGRSSNVGLEILLLPEMFMTSYKQDVALEAEAMFLAEPMVMMSMSQTVTNLTMVIGTESNSLEVGVYFPSGYTNEITVFECTSLVDWDWAIFTNIATTGLSSFEWDPDTAGYETRYWVTVERADDDRDGLENGVEKYVYSTDPGNPDTDGDGISDGDEVQAGTDPLLADSDGDGMSDGAEANLTTSVATNGSGGVLVVVPEGWYHATDPNLNLVYLGE